MRPHSYQIQALDRGMIMPAHNIEIYSALGFRLVDEPGCGLARMARSSVCRVHRVHSNKKLADQGGRQWSARNELDDARVKTGEC